ncbi:hypothetical protein KC19_12G115300 [Ceratodon purpureus]|uniref:AP2/ERF domain-containing protein n=1 Tax=Ceratodon purpureus TaxID=3225 RepID=A0A8T0G6U3_CERPU|nr:hypothetical protein KC19_12G115300 [Ceratodon purpureus]
MESTELKLKGPSDVTVSEELAVPAQRPAMVEFLQQEHRGVKRSRRERCGSSAKERISKMPACVPGKRSSIYRGVTRHRWTGRYEAHLWDKNTWNEAQNKKGKQVYLGAYDDEEAAARAYDLAALKYWGPGTLINFPVTDYARDVEEMQAVSREEYLVSLRRKGSSTKQKAFTRHLSMRRWEDRLDRVLDHKYLLLGNNSSSNMSLEDPAVAFDMQALEYRGINAASNLDLCRYITWLRPERTQTATTSLGPATTVTAATTSNLRDEEDAAVSPTTSDDQYQPEGQQQRRQAWPGQASEPYQLPCLGVWHNSKPAKELGAPSALSLLLSSSIFKSMRERTAMTDATEHETKLNAGVAKGSHSRFLDAPQTSRFYKEPISSEIFSPDVRSFEMSIPPSYAPHEAFTQAGPMYSQSAATCWDPYVVQPLSAQQLSPC